MPHRATIVLGAGVAVTTLTAIIVNITDIGRLLSSLSLGGGLWLIGEIKARDMASRISRQGREMMERMARQTALDAEQARQLRAIADRLYEGEGDGTGPQPLRSVK